MAARQIRSGNQRTQRMNERNKSPDGRSENLRDSPIMAHLLSCPRSEAGYRPLRSPHFRDGRAAFRGGDELITLVGKHPDHDEAEARALLHQMEAKDYSPPRRERILEWQAQQDFPICPTPDDPDSCNAYRELRFPDAVYEHIAEYYEDQTRSGERAQ